MQFIFLLPCICFLVIFVFFPLINNFYYSLHSFALFSPKKTFVGLSNYISLLKDATVITAILNNMRYAIISVICQVWFGLIIASILEDKIFQKIAPFFRIVYFTPVVISISVICLLFSFVYHPQIGLLNNFLKLIGFENLVRPWLGLKETAIYAVIAVSQWQSTGYIMMLFIVAIQKIPKELYEAATIDGAGKIQQFFTITVPQVKEMIFVTTLVTITGSMLVFNEPFILTSGGGPGTSSITMSIHMYLSGFLKDSMGYASTIAVVILFITVILGIIQKNLFKTGQD